MTEHVLLTGGTGFLGSNIIKKIIASGADHVHVLIRPEEGTSARARGKKLAEKISGGMPGRFRRDVARRLHFIEGDISRPRLGISPEGLSALKKITTIYHAAAISEFGWELDDIRKVNVEGTKNLLETALRLKNGRLKRINHISTAYIAGNHNGVFLETDTDIGQKFNNTYEESKFEAEMAVRAYQKKGLAIDIYRPSVLTDAPPADKSNLSLSFRFLMMLVSNNFDELPVGRDAIFNLIPVDVAAEMIYRISSAKARKEDKVYHIVNPEPVAVSAVINTVSAVIGVRKPALVDPRGFKAGKLTFVQQKILGTASPYLRQNLSFDMRDTALMLKGSGIEVPKMSRERITDMFEHYISKGIASVRREYAFKK